LIEMTVPHCQKGQRPFPGNQWPSLSLVLADISHQCPENVQSSHKCERFFFIFKKESCIKARGGKRLFHKQNYLYYKE
jgi:hypothetical protein